MAADPAAIVDLDAAPAIPGGGPASRRRPTRITHPAFWTWVVLVVTWAGVTGAVLAAWLVTGGLSHTGFTLLLVGVGGGFLLLAVGCTLAPYVAESRVDDDMTTYAWGTPCTLHLGGYGGEATVEVRGEIVARLPASGVDGRRALSVGDEELTLCRRGNRVSLADAVGTQAEAVAHTRGALTDHEIAVDGRLLRLRRRTGSTAPRATLLDDLGRAWPVTLGRHRITVRLPDEVHHGGAAFCLVLLGTLTGDLGSVAGPAEPPATRRGTRRRARRRA